MLNLNALYDQFFGFGEYQLRERARKAIILENALEVFRALGSDSSEPDQPEEGRPDRLVAVPLEPPAKVYDPPSRPSPITVVATDGSQIYPDRNIEPLCYLLNIGRIAFQYGTTTRPFMDARPHLYFKGQELSSITGLEIDVVGREIVSVLRDELELSELVDLAVAHRTEGRPILAVADGTLIRWTLKRLHRPELEERLLQRYFEVLEEFRVQNIPICSYISLPGNTEFVNYLSLHKANPDVAADSYDLDGIADRMFFKNVLRPGQRSAIFKSQSHVLKSYPEVHEICYFYLYAMGPGNTSEIARVEFPRWISENPQLIDLVHATALNECEKGNGYPMILSEAHEQAVVRSNERYLFYEMLEREMLRGGAALEVSSKMRSKEDPVL